MFRINSNLWKQCFWVMAYILVDPNLHTSIRAETKPAIRQDIDATKVVDLSYLTSHCPRLEAVFNEALRLNAAAISLRYVTEPTIINNKLLRAGSKVIMPCRPLHFDPQIFGPNPDQFDPNRFLNNPALAQNFSFRPWGGGSVLCPGRFLARRAVCAFVTMALHEFDISVVEGQRFPRRDDVTPNLGLMAPVMKDDLMIRVQRRGLV